MKSIKIFPLLFAAHLTMTYFSADAQVKITDGLVITMDANSLLELESNNKGLLIPRIALNNLNLPAPLIAPVLAGMIVFSSGETVADRFYYLNGTKWIRVISTGTNIMQSFTKRADATLPVAGTLALNNSVRVNDMTHLFIKSYGLSEPSFIRLVAGYSDDSLSYDPLCIYFDAKATYNFDGQYDAYKLFNTDKKVTNFYSFANDGSKLSINALPLNDDSFCNVRLGLKTERGGDVIFRIKYIQGVFPFNNIFITDVITGTTQDLLLNKQYKVNLIAGDYQNRFFLNLSNLITDTPDFTSDTDWINIYSSHGILKAEINLLSCKKGTLTILNLMGQALFIHKIYEAGYHEFSPVVKDGIYIVTFISGNRRVSKKIFIQSQ